MMESLQLIVPQSTVSVNNLAVSFLNAQYQQSDFYVDEGTGTALNNMELQVQNNGSAAIQFATSDLTVQNLPQIPILIQVDNILSSDEISSMSLNESDWTMQTLTIDQVNFWALSPTENVSVETGQSLTISFNELRIAAKPIRNGTVNTQLNYAQNQAKESPEFQQTITLLNNPDGPLKPLSDDLLVEFVTQDGQSEEANLVTRTPISLTDEINTLYLHFKNKKTNKPLIAKPQEGREARFFLSLVASDVPEGTSDALATATEINDIDISVHNLSNANYNWSIRKNSQNQIPFWILKPLNDEVLGNSESENMNDGEIEFSLDNIITQLPTGTTTMYLTYRNVPGYLDGTIPLSIEIDADPAYIGSFLANSKLKLKIHEGTPFKLSYAVHSLDAEEWIITKSEEPIHTFSTKPDETCIANFDYTISDSGSYDLELKAKNHPVSKNIPATGKEKIKIVSFVFANGKTKAESAFPKTFTLKCIVYSKSAQEWQVTGSEEWQPSGSGFTFNESFTSPGGYKLCKKNISVSINSAGQYSIKLWLESSETMVSSSVFITVDSNDRNTYYLISGSFGVGGLTTQNDRYIKYIPSDSIKPVSCIRNYKGGVGYFDYYGYFRPFPNLNQFPAFNSNPQTVISFDAFVDNFSSQSPRIPHICQDSKIYYLDGPLNPSGYGPVTMKQYINGEIEIDPDFPPQLFLSNHFKRTDNYYIFIQTKNDIYRYQVQSEEGQNDALIKKTVIISGIQMTSILCIDPVNKYLYFIANGTDLIESDFDGGTTTLCQIPNTAQTVLAFDKPYLCWYQYQNDSDKGKLVNYSLDKNRIVYTIEIEHNLAMPLSGLAISD